MSRTILVTGATGFLGSRLCRLLAADGVAVRALARNPDAAKARLPGVALVRWAAGEPVPPDVLEGVTAVVSLVGEPIGARRWTPERKQALARSRVDATRAVVQAMAARSPGARPRVLVSASAVGYYGDRGDEVLTETAGPGTGYSAGLCRDWEAAAEKARALGVRVVFLRTGLALARDGGALAQMLPPFRLGLGGWIGSGRQWFPWIHVDDELALIHHALENDAVEGPLNAAAPGEATNRTFSKALGRALHRPVLLPIPTLALRLRFGSQITRELLLASQRVRPEKALATGFKFAHPDLPEALVHVLR